MRVGFSAGVVYNNRMLETQALSFKRQAHTLFENLCFQAKSSSLTQVMGENGSGKTTLLRILAGFLPASSGVIYYQDSAITEKNSLYRHAIAYLGHSNALKPGLTVKENILSHANLMGGIPNAVTLETLLRQFNLKTHAKKFAYELSAGQQRKLALINVILSEKPIWLLDEPLAALDERGHQQFNNKLAAHVEKGGVAIVATHQALQLNINAIQTLAL